MAGPITAMTGLDPKVSKPPDVEIMPRACRRAPFQHEPYDAAAVQWPNRPHETSKLPCNVAMKVRIDNDSQVPYYFWQPGSVIREISVNTMKRLISVVSGYPDVVFGASAVHGPRA